jgi:hypothetical protein
VISRDKAIKYAELKEVPYREVSSLTGEGVEELFEFALSLYI